MFPLHVSQVADQIGKLLHIHRVKSVFKSVLKISPPLSSKSKIPCSCGDVYLGEERVPVSINVFNVVVFFRSRAVAEHQQVMLSNSLRCYLCHSEISVCCHQENWRNYREEKNHKFFLNSTPQAQPNISSVTLDQSKHKDIFEKREYLWYLYTE